MSEVQPLIDGFWRLTTVLSVFAANKATNTAIGGGFTQQFHL